MSRLSLTSLSLPHTRFILCRLSCPVECQSISNFSPRLSWTRLIEGNLNMLLTDSYISCLPHPEHAPSKMNQSTCMNTHLHMHSTQPHCEYRIYSVVMPPKPRKLTTKQLNNTLSETRILRESHPCKLICFIIKYYLYRFI